MATYEHHDAIPNSHDLDATSSGSPLGRHQLGIVSALSARHLARALPTRTYGQLFMTPELPISDHPKNQYRTFIFWLGTLCVEVVALLTKIITFPFIDAWAEEFDLRRPALWLFVTAYYFPTILQLFMFWITLGLEWIPIAPLAKVIWYQFALVVTSLIFGSYLCGAVLMLLHFLNGLS